MTTPFSLSAQDQADFIEQGFVLVRGVFSPVTAKQCRDEIWRLLAEQGITRDPTSWSHVKVR